MHRILIAVIACVVAASAAAAAPADDVMAAEHALSDLAAKGLPRAYLAYLADDAEDFGAGGTAPLYGRAAYEASVKAGKADNPKGSLLSWSPVHVKMSSDGTMAAVDGRYLRVWKKDLSGAWKIAADMATNDPAKP